ncbi:MAG TPA: anti-sigma factor [Rubrobacteraceae bacterium]|jgi:anti-sigma-K factor RskA|nr:anti-sigma factor [Rubrobacteraceae bacterium]
MNHERFDELKDAYVLGALPEEERRELEEYLAQHPERQAEVDELGAFAGLLALSPQEHEPSPELRQSIMSVVESEARSFAGSDPRFAGLRELFSLQNLALAGAALLVIGLFSWNILLQGEIRDLQGRVANLQETPQSRMVALEGTGDAPQQGHAEVMILDDDRAVLMAEDMPRAPEGRTYQIWVIEGDVPKPGGLFEPRGESVAAVVEKPLDEGDVIAVTIEPAGGSQQPTTDPLMTAKL